ncbi:uncharacterized protein ACB058_003924 [Synchiropus picturatus]
MDSWKIQVVALTFCTLVQTSPALSRIVEASPELFQKWDGPQRNLPLTALWKRSKANRFYGLMGKRSGTKRPLKFTRKKKGESFVGLMGRSIHTDYGPEDFPSASTADVSQKPQEHGAPEEWLTVQY